jgi:hypothetical protein
LLTLLSALIYRVSSGYAKVILPPLPAAGASNAKAALLEPDSQHTLAATYYRLTTDMNATLMLSNQGPNLKLVQVTLFARNGETLAVPSFILSGQEVRAIALRDHVAVGSVFAEGRLEVSYIGKSMELGGVLQLADESHSLMFDEELLEPAKAFVSRRLEGVWWLPSQASDITLALSNQSNAAISATVRVNGTSPRQNAPQTFVLGPHETRALDMNALAGRQVHHLAQTGGVSLTHTGAKGELLARAFIQDTDAGYSNAIEFADPAKAKSARLYGAGLRIGAVGGERLEQIVVARNVGDAATTVTGRINYLAADGAWATVNLPAKTLAAQETDTFGITAALRSQGVNQAHAASLSLAYTGAPGSVIVAAQSVSRNNTHVFRVPLRDVTATYSSTGTYPWNLAGDNSAYIYLTNVTDEPQKYTLQIDYEGGNYLLGLKTLAARGTEVLDLRKLRDEQTPDLNGNRIPLNVSGGKAFWSIRGTSRRAIIGRIEQVNLTSGLSSTAACGRCCPDSFASSFLVPFGAVGIIGSTTSFTIMRTDRDCYGDYRAPYPTPGFFSSTNTAVVTVDSIGLATGVGVGTTNIQGTFFADTYINCGDEAANDEYCCDQFIDEVTCEAACDILPQIDSISPVRALIGQPVDVVISGSGFGNNPTVNAGSGISVVINSSTSTTIHARFNMAGNVTPGNHGVFVTTSTGFMSNGENFFVQVPSEFIALNLSRGCYAL